MTELTILYWRDIPAQVIVGRGRGGTKLALPERFEQAIDRAAMASGAAGTEAYLGAWRRVAGGPVSGDPGEAARAAAARLEAEYDAARLKALIASGGRA
jgi:hypothetical protein